LSSGLRIVSGLQKESVWWKLVLLPADALARVTAGRFVSWWQKHPAAITRRNFEP